MAMVPKNLILQKIDDLHSYAEIKQPARVHFIPDLKVRVFVTLCAPIVIKRKMRIKHQKNIRIEEKLRNLQESFYSPFSGREKQILDRSRALINFISSS